MFKRFFIPFTLAFFLQSYSQAQTAQDGLALLFSSFEAKEDQQELVKFLKNTNGKEKEYLGGLATEYEFFVLRSDALQVHFRLYSRMNDEDKLSENKTIARSVKKYIDQSNASLESLSAIQGKSKLKITNDGAEKLKVRIKSSIEKITKFSNQ